MNASTAIKGPDEPAPAKFADAYAELQAIAAKLKPEPGQIPDVDAIEPLVRRANILAAHCQERIDSVRKLIGEQSIS
jgi:exonuclease VII small subunit